MSVPVPLRLTLESHDPSATQAIAQAIAGLLRDGDLIVLSGDLGAGKTCFTQGVARGLGIGGRVTSPTFTLANRYAGRLTLNHLDVYRLDHLDETVDLDLPELLEEGVTVIEWGERILPVLGPEVLVLRILHGAVNDDDRHIEIEARGDRWRDRMPGLIDAVGRWISC